MSKSIMFAAVLIVSSAAGSQACEHCNGGTAVPGNWMNGCCEREPMWSDHLWDNYCNEGHGYHEKCHGGCGHGCRRGLLAGFRGFGHGLGHGHCVETPIDCASGHCADAAPAVDAPSPAPEPAEIPRPAAEQHTSHSAAAVHGPGCLCPQCTPQLNPSGLTPADVLSSVQPSEAEFRTESAFVPQQGQPQLLNATPNDQ